jgi:hypothetical protein
MGEIVPIFSQKFFQNFFTNISFTPLNPLSTCQKVIYGGDTEGGRGTYVRSPMREGVCQTIRGSLQVINNMVVDKFTYEKLLT